jgi:hypothetical protein
MIIWSVKFICERCKSVKELAYEHNKDRVPVVDLPVQTALPRVCHCGSWSGPDTKEEG